MGLLLRLWNLTYGTTAILVQFFERRSPEAVLQRERERFRCVLGEFNKGLVTHATLIERLKSDVAEHESRATGLVTKVEALVKAGERELAGRSALELRSVQSSLSTDRKRLQGMEERYQALLASREKATFETRRRMERLRNQIGDLKVNRAVADLEGMAAAMVGSINDPGDDLNRLGEMLNQENEKARARIRVATGGFENNPSSFGEDERDALAAQALEEYLVGKKQVLPLALLECSLVPVATKSSNQH